MLHGFEYSACLVTFNTELASAGTGIASAFRVTPTTLLLSLAVALCAQTQVFLVARVIALHLFCRERNYFHFFIWMLQSRFKICVCKTDCRIDSYTQETSWAM